jgi:hydrogenase maturation factor
VTISNPSGDDFIVNLTATTRITTTQTVSANALKSGDAVMITGTANGQGVINASNVSILQALPNGRPTATATPNS